MRARHLIPLGVGACVVLQAAAAKPRQSTVTAKPEYPLYCAGVVVGMSTDTDLKRMYGTGLFQRGEGHGGGRYFIDPKGQVTLHVTTGTGGVIESVTYRKGVHLPSSTTTGRRAAVAASLTSGERLQWGIRLGDTVDEIIRQLGKPAKDLRTGSSRVLHYRAEEMPYILFYEADFNFDRGRLVSVRLYNGC